MNQIVNTHIDWTTNTARVTFDNGMYVDLTPSETNKLAGIFPTTKLNTQPSVGTSQNKVIFSPAIQAAILSNVIVYAQAYPIQHLTSRGFANPGYTGNNPLEDNFPAYWAWLQQYRITNNDPTAT